MVEKQGTFSWKGTSQPLENVRILGERVELVPIHNGFAEAILKEFTPEITRYMGPAPARCIEDCYSFIDGATQARTEGHDLACAVVLQATGEFLGCTGLHGRGKLRTPELGIWIKKGAHGHGYGREAVSALTQWARQYLVIEGLIYPVSRENTPSRKIAESLGGIVTEERKAINGVGTVLDEVVYLIPA